jgi:hypothetical protein
MMNPGRPTIAGCKEAATLLGHSLYVSRGWA